MYTMSAIKKFIVEARDVIHDMLDDTDIAVLEKLKRGPAIVYPDKNAQRIVDRLANIGACKISMVRSGPLNILTGEIMVRLTELGIQMLNNVEKRC